MIYGANYKHSEKISIKFFKNRALKFRRKKVMKFYYFFSLEIKSDISVCNSNRNVDYNYYSNIYRQ